MSKISDNGKFLHLEGVRLAYRAKDNAIVLTSTDEDLADQGFILTLSKSSASEHILRNLLTRKGLIKETTAMRTLKDFIAKNIIKESPQKSTSKMIKSVQREDNSSIPLRADYHPDFENSNPHRIPLGIKEHNEEVVWDTNKDAHAVVSGVAGSGKTILLDSMIRHCLGHRSAWDVYAIGWKGIDFPYLNSRDFSNTKYARDLTESLDLLKDIERTMTMRYEDLQKFDRAEAELLYPFKSILLVIDEFAYFANRPIADDRYDHEGWEEMQSILDRLIRTGRGVGIHLLVSTQIPSANVLPSTVLKEFSFRIHTGVFDEIRARLLFKDPSLKLSENVKGRALSKSMNTGEVNEFQVYLSPRDWWNRLQA